MPRLVRRQPLLKRLQDRFDFLDILFQLQETFDVDGYDDTLQAWVVPCGVACNIVFIVAKLGSRAGSRGGDDVFSDFEGRSPSAWFAWMATSLTYLLSLACVVNAIFTFFRTRQYRLFEQPVDDAPATPSAHLVRVDSSPMSSPLQHLSRTIAEATSRSRAHIDPERDVWEIAVWDPKPFNLTLFTLFSPGHLVLYYAMLPPAPTDQSPATKVVLAFFFGVLISLQLGTLRTSFSQQAKDSALIHGEVMNEYDTKFVRPALNHAVRDVGIQTRESSTTPRGTKAREVDIYTPTTIVKRAFKTNPNPNYARQYDPDNLSVEPTSSSRRTSDFDVQRTPSSLISPSNPYALPTGYTSAYSNASTATGPDFSSPLKQHHQRIRERAPASRSDGGNLGVYSHPASPLRKAASSSNLLGGRQSQQSTRAGSPLKRLSTPGAGGNGGLDPSGRVRRRESLGRY